MHTLRGCDAGVMLVKLGDIKPPIWASGSGDRELELSKAAGGGRAANGRGGGTIALIFFAGGRISTSCTFIAP